MISNYKKAYREMFEIFKYMDEEDKKLIPNEVFCVIEKNMDNEYQFEINENLSLAEQDLLEETRALLAVIFRDYLASENQKDKIKRKINYDLQKVDDEKKEKYNPDDIFKNETYKEAENNQMTAMIEYKENAFKKLINKIKSLLHLN